MSLIIATETNKAYIISSIYNIGSIDIFNITGFADSITGQTIDRFFLKEFQVSNDNLLFTSWKSLTNENLQEVTTRVNTNLFFKLKYTRVGKDTTGSLLLNSIAFTSSNTGLNIDDIAKEYPTTYSSIFKELVIYNPVVLEIQKNLLDKIKGTGILSNFIIRNEKDTTLSLEDFNSFWKTIATFYAYLAAFSEYLLAIYSNYKLLNAYLKSHNIFLSENETLEELQYLAQHYFEEIYRRGTVSVFKEENFEFNDESVLPITGEILRLINYNLSDEFLVNVFDHKNVGWCLGNSSPLYRGISSDNFQLIKGYEQTDSAVDLSLYPLTYSVASQVTIVNDTDINKDVILISGLTSDDIGINSDGITQLDKAILKINPGMNYEISFWIKFKNNDSSNSVAFKCLALDKDDNLLTCIDSVTGSASSTFISNLTLASDDIYYFVRGIIFSKGTLPNGTILNYGVGNNLIFDDTVDPIKILPLLYVEGTDTSTLEVYIDDFKVRPSFLSHSLGFLNLKNLIYLFMSNNSHNTNDKVYNIIREFLLPYDCNIIIQFLDSSIVNIEPTTENTASTESPTTNTTSTTSTSTTSTSTSTTSTTSTTTTCPIDSIDVELAGSQVVTFSGTPSGPFYVEFMSDMGGSPLEIYGVMLPDTFDLSPTLDVYGTWTFILEGGCIYTKTITRPTTTSTSTTTSSTTTTSTTLTPTTTTTLTPPTTTTLEPVSTTTQEPCPACLTILSVNPVSGFSNKLHIVVVRPECLTIPPYSITTSPSSTFISFDPITSIITFSSPIGVTTGDTVTFSKVGCPDIIFEYNSGTGSWNIS